MIMKKMRLFILAIVILAFAAALARPSTAQAQGEEFSWMLLTVQNDSQFDYTLNLLSVYGATTYSLTVPPHTTQQFFVDKGWYAYTQYACNLSSSGTFDFTDTHYTIHVPICGAKPWQSAEVGASLLYDTALDIRPIRITVRNRTQLPIEVYIRTPNEHHFLTFEPLEIQEVLLNNQDERYAYSYLACGVLKTGYLKPYRGIPFDLTCDSNN